MTAATTDRRRSAYPPEVDAIIEQVRGEVAAGDRLPGLKRMRARFRIGDDKARQVREAIRAELADGLLQRGTRRPLHAVNNEQQVPDTDAAEAPEDGEDGVPEGVPARTDTSDIEHHDPVPGTAALEVPELPEVPEVPEVPGEVAWEEWGGSYLMTSRSEAEQDQDAAVDGRVRAAWRTSRERAGLAEAARYDRESRAADTIADRQVTDRLWATRAASDADRLTSPAARLVFLAKARQAVYSIFLALIIGGTAWGSVNARATLLPTVHHPSGLVSTVLFGVDPLVNGLLVALLIVRAALSARGEYGQRMGRLAVIEVGLLAATLLLNAGPYLPLIGGWVGFLPAFAHALPALVVTATVAVFPQVDAAFAAMLRAARTELARS